MNELYKQEVLELTELLRDDEENEYGVIVTKDIKISKYSRSTQDGKNNVNSFKLKDITNEKDEIDKYPQISVAIDMIKNEELL